jgi:type IV fimbrial biogenesis protein FimT
MIRQVKGFTIIELMITLVVVGTLLLIAVPSFQSWIERNRIRTAAEGVLNGLQLARVEAIKRNAIVTMTLLADYGWEVKDASNTVIQARRGVEGSQATFVTVKLAAVVNLPQDISFNGLGRMTLPASDLTLSIVPTAGAECTAAGPKNCLSLNLTRGGLLRMCDPSPAKAGTPQAC